MVTAAPAPPRSCQGGARRPSSAESTRLHLRVLGALHGMNLVKNDTYLDTAKAKQEDVGSVGQTNCCAASVEE